MKIPTYPNDFFDFSKGYNVKDEQINEWINKGVRELESNPEQHYYGVSSGNTFVQVFRIDEETTLSKYRITVSKAYASAEIPAYEDDVE